MVRPLPDGASLVTVATSDSISHGAAIPFTGVEALVTGRGCSVCGIGLLSLRGGPMVTSGLSMFQMLGYGGLKSSLILLLRVITGVLRADR